MLTYLALGDSYTIGEGCPIFDSFPYQSVQLLRHQGKNFNAPEIIAKTGWTTSELADQLNNTLLNDTYNIVSLLIGVNNQYRGLTTSQYTLEFEVLLNKAIEKAGKQRNHVFVLSVPDWGTTTFAKDRDPNMISEDISRFNTINKKISKLHNVHYIDITTGSPETVVNPDYLAADGLHPSGKAYSRWAKLLTDSVLPIVS